MLPSRINKSKQNESRVNFGERIAIMRRLGWLIVAAWPLVAMAQTPDARRRADSRHADRHQGRGRAIEGDFSQGDPGIGKGDARLRVESFGRRLPRSTARLNGSGLGAGPFESGGDGRRRRGRVGGVPDERGIRR